MTRTVFRSKSGRSNIRASSHRVPGRENGTMAIATARDATSRKSLCQPSSAVRNFAGAKGTALVADRHDLEAEIVGEREGKLKVQHRPMIQRSITLCSAQRTGSRLLVKKGLR